MTSDLGDDTARAIREAVGDAFRLYASGVHPPSQPEITEQRIKELARQVALEIVNETLEALGLPIDKDHRAETRRNIGGLIAIRRTGLGFVKTVLYVAAGGAATWILAHFGIKVDGGKP